VLLLEAVEELIDSSLRVLGVVIVNQLRHLTIINLVKEVY
jgi:hypothetical protein